MAATLKPPPIHKQSNGTMADDHEHHRDRRGGGSDKKKSSSKKRGRRDDRDRRRHGRKRERDDRSSSSSSSSSSAASALSLSDDDERRRKSKKRRKGDREEHSKKSRRRDREKDHRRDKKRKKKKKSGSKSSKKHKRRSRSLSRSGSRSRSRGRSSSPSHQAAEAADDPLRRNHEFASAVQSLLSAHPNLSTELPVILIRMAGGTTFNLGAMPDVGAAQGLERVFATLSQYGVKLDATGSWAWDDGSGGGAGSARLRRPGAELILLRIARTLLDGIGITAEAAAGYEERRKREAEQQEQQRQEAAALASHLAASEQRDDDGSARSAVRALLAKYEERAAKGGGDDSSTLPSELGGIVNLMLEGESIVLDGIPDEKLRSDLDALFTTLGLMKAEVEEDSDDEEDDDDGDGDGDGPALGFTLPDKAKSDGLIRSNVLAVLDECRVIQAGGATIPVPVTKKRVIGPAMGPPPGFSASEALQEYAAAPAPDDSDEGDDEGPAPAGSILAKRRQRTGQSISASSVRTMAEQRKMELEDVAAGGTGVPSAAVAGGREEWMLTPGKHDFLKGIKSADPTKSRKFKNEKARGSSGPVDVGPQLTAAQQAEVDAIQRQVEEARGPTLIDQHRHMRAEEKEAARKSGKDKDFNWNRDRDLDAGRRVDKDHLHMVLGGAKEGLKDKFQGSISRGFM